MNPLYFVNLKPNLNSSRLSYPEMWDKRKKNVDTFPNFGVYVFLSFSFRNVDSLLLVDCSF